MDTRKLEHFLAVIKYGQFNLAAEACKVTQQAISKSIAKLEEELGVVLFERSVYGATPTLFGTALEARAKSALAELRLAESEITALNMRKDGRLGIGVGITLTGEFIPKVVHLFRSLHPGVAVSLTVNNSEVLYEKLLRGDLDIVVSAPPLAMPIDSHIVTAPILTEIEAVVVRRGHPLTKLPKVRIGDLLPYTWIAPAEPERWWVQICQAYGDHGVAPPRDVIRTDSPALALGLLLADDCLCLMGRDMMAKEVAEGALVRLSVDSLMRPRPVHLATRSRAVQSPAVTAILPIFRQVAAELYPA
jgi:DNA-binding transcriptional LysR family regulator